MAQPSGDPIVEGLRLTEVASVADATEQLYGQKTYMSHDMRPLAPTKFAGPAVTVMLKKEEHKDGAAASQGMLDLIDAAPAGSVYVMVLEDGLDYAGIGGLMATAMKVRGLAGAVIDAARARHAADPADPVPRLQPRHRALHHHQSLSRGGRERAGDLRGREGESRRLHHRPMKTASSWCRRRTPPTS